jgi:hypothetical protein
MVTHRLMERLPNSIATPFNFVTLGSEIRLASKTNTKHAGDGVHKGHAVIGRYPGVVVAWG